MSSTLVEDHLYLVHFVLKQYRSALAAFHIEYEDAFQIGAIGLVQATKSYDPEKSSFATYAVIKIKDELCKYFRSLNAKKRRGQVVSLNNLLTCDSETPFIDTLVDDRTHNEFDNVLTDAMISRLILQLPKREKDLLSTVYYNHIESRVQLGKWLQVNESTVYKTLRKLRTRLKPILDIRKAACVGA